MPTLFKYNIAAWTAGETVKIQFGSLAVSHSGGHAEFSISYDGGKAFVVLIQVLRYVFVGKYPGAITNEVSVLAYYIKLPDKLPSSDKAVFAWTWVNASGNREFYMNCADVAIKGTSDSITGKEMTIVNYPNYPTVPEFKRNYETAINYYTTDAKYVKVYGNGKSEVAKAADSDITYENGNNNVNGGSSNVQSEVSISSPPISSSVYQPSDNTNRYNGASNTNTAIGRDAGGTSVNTGTTYDGDGFSANLSSNDLNPQFKGFVYVNSDNVSISYNNRGDQYGDKDEDEDEDCDDEDDAEE